MQKSRPFVLHFYTFKKPDTLRYTIFYKTFDIGIYIQKALHSALRDVFIYKKPDTSQKARQFVLRFYIKKILTHCVKRFFMEFLKLVERGEFLYAKSNAFCVTFLFAKTNSPCVTFLYNVRLKWKDKLCSRFSTLPQL